MSAIARHILNLILDATYTIMLMFKRFTPPQGEFDQMSTGSYLVY